jgi:hypothetical protein
VPQAPAWRRRPPALSAGRRVGVPTVGDDGPHAAVLDGPARDDKRRSFHHIAREYSRRRAAVLGEQEAEIPPPRIPYSTFNPTRYEASRGRRSTEDNIYSHGRIFIHIRALLSHPCAGASTDLFKSLNIYPEVLQWAVWD